MARPTNFDFSKFIDRQGVYFESGMFCVVVLERVETGDDGIRLTLRADSRNPLICHYRENPPRFASDEKPFGERWDTFTLWNFFFLTPELDPEHWDGSPYLGFHLFFSKDVLQRFVRHDIGWTESYW